MDISDVEHWTRKLELQVPYISAAADKLNCNKTFAEIEEQRSDLNQTIYYIVRLTYAVDDLKTKRNWWQIRKRN